DAEGPGTWSALDVEGPPVGRKEHTMVLDPTGYRLAVFGGERCGGYGPEVFGLDLGETPVGIADAPPIAADLALRVLSNPTERDITVAFQLPSPAQTMLDLIDVSGRCVARRDLGTVPAGSHTIILDGRRQPAGIYFVRLIHAGRAMTTKVSLLRH
ncbi:MAG TPA: T9SS type A sorting domain-containing protein, partial [Candidatus Udaeobacter sp.]|nr:T9SS type A sorting domain-containing protein [Candidatus Udaeobacter sp.]